MVFVGIDLHSPAFDFLRDALIANRTGRPTPPLLPTL